MSLPQPKGSAFTYADYIRWEGRWELLEGEAYAMTPSPGTRHQELVLALAIQISRQFETYQKQGGGGGCRLFLSPLDVILAPDLVVQPDLIIVCDPTKITERGIEGAPDLVVEVLSPGSASRDLVQKRWIYERAGVPEYLIVDPMDGLAELLVLKDGSYVSAARSEAALRLKVLQGRLVLDLPLTASSPSA